MLRRMLWGIAICVLVAGAGLLWLWRDPALRHEIKTLAGLEPRAQLTALPIGVPQTRPSRTLIELTPLLQASAAASATSSPSPSASERAPASQAPTLSLTLEASPTPEATLTPSPVPSPTEIVRNGRVYRAYIEAAVKEGQAYQYSCEFDAAWVILQTYGFDVDVDSIIARTVIDSSVEPSYRETPNGFEIYGGDIRTGFSGDYRSSFLARSTGAVFKPVFESYGLRVDEVHSREALEQALLDGALVWIKTTVDFKPWRPATWITPQGERIQTVLGNDHAVVVMGFNDEVVVIRDVLGPTSTGRNRPLEYEVAWDTFLAAWGAQNNDGIAVYPTP